MLFDDDFVMNQLPGGGLFGGLESGLGGFSGLDAGEIVIVGRVPGSLYIDDFSAGETALQHILPLIFNESELGAAGQEFAGPAIDVADAPVVPANDEESQAIVLLADHKVDEPAGFILTGDFAPLADLDQGGFGRPDIDLTPVEPFYHEPSASLSAEVLPVTYIGGQPYHSLSFLIIDTPYAFNDDSLSDSIRPSIDSLLGLADEADAWILPAVGKGAWRLS